MVGAGAGEHGGDGAGDDVAGREVPAGVDPGHHRAAGQVDQARPLAAQRLGDQRRAAAEARHPQRGGVELHELDVGQRRARPQRERPAVGGGDRGVRRRLVEPADPAGGEQDGGGGDDAQLTRRRRRRPDPSRGRRACRRTATAVCPASTVTSPGSAASRARSTSAPVASPPAWMTRVVPWPPSRVRARRAPRVGRGVEHRAPGPQLGHRVGPAGEDLAGRGVVDQPAARGQRVGHVRVDAVARDVTEHDGDPALRPPRATPRPARPW